MIETVLTLLAGLGGLGSLISMAVNLLKRFGVVQDGTSDTWVQGMNLAAFVAIATVYLFNVPVDWGTVDRVLVFLATFLGFVLQLLGSKVTYSVVKGTPGIGYSFPE